MIQMLFQKFVDLPRWSRKPLWRVLHWFLVTWDDRVHMKFMNYGFDDEQQPRPVLDSDDESDRYSIQLYHHTVSSLDLTGLTMLEVGCGRGGGASYIARYLGPATYVGLDQSKRSIGFCNSFYQVPGLSFIQGDAEDISLPDNAFDAVVNVESSRCYGRVDRFLAEVHRVLRPGGHLLFVDMRLVGAAELLKTQFQDAGLTIELERNITANVLAGLEQDNDRRRQLVEDNGPRYMRNSLLHFAGVRGTERFAAFASGRMQYWSYVLRA